MCWSLPSSSARSACGSLRKWSTDGSCQRSSTQTTRMWSTCLGSHYLTMSWAPYCIQKYLRRYLPTYVRTICTFGISLAEQPLYKCCLSLITTYIQGYVLEDKAVTVTIIMISCKQMYVLVSVGMHRKVSVCTCMWVWACVCVCVCC